MRFTRALAAAAIPAVLALTIPTMASAAITTDVVRQRAEQACYDDVNRLCNDAIPDEDKIKICMAAHRVQLNPKCRAVFDANVK